MNYLQKKKLAFMSIVNQIKGFIRTISGAFPLTLTDCVDNKSITNYSIHGNSMQDGVPTPDAPIEVESVGELTRNLITANDGYIHKISENRYIKYETETQVFTIQGQGLLTHVYFPETIPSGTTTSIFAEIINDDYEIVKGELTIGGYGVSPSWQNVLNFSATSAKKQSGVYTITADINRICIFVDANADVKNVKVRITYAVCDTALTEYEPYGYKIPITVSGKNLFNKSDYQVDVNGAIGFSIRHLKIGTKYTISSNKPLTWVKISLASSGYNSVQFANESGFYKYSFTMQRHSNISENETQYLFLGSTVGERTFVNNISQLDGFDIQIEEGSTTTDYEPYHESISTNIYLDEPLRKVGDYADYIDFENNEIVRNIGKYTFTGDERDWGGAVGYTGSFGYTVNISDLSLTVHKVGLCNHLTQSGFAGSVNRFAFHDAANHPYCCIFFLEKDFPDLGTYSPETAKQIVKQMYDSGEPLILYYNTNTPTKEFVELPIIPTFKGTSIISVDTTIQPSNAEIEYYSNAKER